MSVTEGLQDGGLCAGAGMGSQALWVQTPAGKALNRAPQARPSKAGGDDVFPDFQTGVFKLSELGEQRSTSWEVGVVSVTRGFCVCVCV